MDSGNSSSMQSSSGGGVGGDQEEYDSRADQSISALFNNNKTTTVPTQLEYSLIANYINSPWSIENPLWSTTFTDVYGQPTPISSEPILFQQNLGTVSNNTTSLLCSVPTNKNKNGFNNIVKGNTKKRSRVSRRAPTTVLTTDTSNFRAMVQEFTGTPSTPFTSLSFSPFPRSRFDHFGSSSSLQPLKPFPQNLNKNTQNIANPFINNQFPNNPSTHKSILCENPKPLSLATSDNGFGNVDVGTNFEGLHNIIVSSTSSMSDDKTNPKYYSWRTIDGAKI